MHSEPESALSSIGDGKYWIALHPKQHCAFYEIGAEIDQRAILSQITVPTLILHGDADPLVSTATARSLAAAL